MSSTTPPDEPPGAQAVPAEAGENRDPEEIATEILETLEADHRYCANCFRKVREVEPPGMRSGGKLPPEFAIGYAYPTKHTMKGVAEVLRPTDPAAADWAFLPTAELFSERQICVCGATQHRTQEHHFSKERAMERAKRLSSAIGDLREEFYAGSKAEVVKARQYHHSRDALLDSLRRLKSKPDLQFRDNAILTRALKLAVKHSSYES